MKFRIIVREVFAKGVDRSRIPVRRSDQIRHRHCEQENQKGEGGGEMAGGAGDHPPECGKIEFMKWPVSNDCILKYLSSSQRLDSEGNFRAPFVRNVIKERGRWGVSILTLQHNQDRDMFLSLLVFMKILVLYLKVGKLIQLNLIQYLTESHHTFSYGSPDIVPIFFVVDCHIALGIHILMSLRTSPLKSNEDQKLQALLQHDQLVIFLHLLGCDSNGHAHRPFSPIYLNNVKVVDSIADRVYNLVEDCFKDNQTAYVFTADHGMSERPFQPLRHHSSILEKIKQLIVTRDYKCALKLSEDLRSSALDGLHYFQTYDWTLLMTVVLLVILAGWCILSSMYCSLMLHSLEILPRKN
ncbi:GPI ethanolamine phosphate transferase 1-like protein [Drosera capensis]